MRGKTLVDLVHHQMGTTAYADAMNEIAQGLGIEAAAQVRRQPVQRPTPQPATKRTPAAPTPKTAGSALAAVKQADIAAAKQAQAALPPVERLPPEDLDRAYRLLLGSLSLSPDHVGFLKNRRGYGAHEISEGMYRSSPVGEAASAAAQAVVDVIGAEAARRLPGLAKTSTGWKMLTAKGPAPEGVTPLSHGDGLITPIFDIQRRIVALRLRAHAVEKGEIVKKVIWLSSQSFGGASPGAQMHYCRPKEVAARPWDRTRLLVTEGEDKAYISALALGCRSMSFPGLNPGAGKAIAEALQDVRRQWPEISTIDLAIDQDQPIKIRTAEHALQSIRDLSTAIDQMPGLTLRLGRWEPEHKGIDDCIIAELRARRQPERPGSSIHFSAEFTSEKIAELEAIIAANAAA
jgi:hypothetical protein